MPRKNASAYETGNSVFAQRLTETMKNRGENQTTLAEKITKQYVTIQRQTISLYMNGQSRPDTERLTAIAKILEVSADYLLGLSDEPSDKVDIRAACLTTGLSEHSVQILRLFHLAGANTVQKVLDFLLLDMQEKDEGSDLNSVIDLLLFFLQYNPSTTQINAVFPGGQIVDAAKKQRIGPVLFLNQRTIENATLSELTQALIALKRRYQDLTQNP